MQSYKMYSQITSYTPKSVNTPTSPEAALLGRFGDIPIGYYTGTADVSIPIYSLNLSGLDVPITLRYHNSGIKVSDEATWVGLGWDLSPGGAIIQEVRGRNDETDDPTLLMGYNQIMSRFNAYGAAGFYKVLKQVGCTYYNWECRYICTLNGGCVLPPAPHDTEYSDNAGAIWSLLQGHGDPDIYHYNFGGYSGKFYINPQTKEFVLMDKKADIIFTKNTSAGAFTATTPDGTVYIFNVYEEINGNLAQWEYDYKSGRTYKLTNIKTASGKGASFYYEDAHIASLGLYQNAILTTCDFDPAPNFNYPQFNNVPVAESDILILKKIVTSDAIIDFNLESREDINLNIPYITSNMKRLKSIDISSAVTEQKIKTFEFKYSYFTSNNNGIPNSSIVGSSLIYNNLDVLGKRLKLEELQEIAYSGTTITSKPSYKFNYDTSTTMPIKVSNSIDFYGYYNGTNNTSLLPDLDYFDYPYALRINNTFSPVFPNNQYNKSNRYANNTYAGVNMLKKITYPTGGATVFEYEPNSFNNEFIPDQAKIDISKKHGSMAHRGAGWSTNQDYHQDFTIDKSVTIKFVNKVLNGWTYQNQQTPNPAMPEYTYQNFANLTNNPPLYSKIVLKRTRVASNGQNTIDILKEWSLNSVLHVDFQNNHGVVWNEEFHIEHDPAYNTYYSIDIINLLNYSGLDTYHIAGIYCDYTFYDNNGVDTSESNQAGMRIKSIKNYAENGILISHKNIKYYDGKLLNHFEPIKWRDVHCFKCTAPAPPGVFCGCSQFLESYATEYSISSDILNTAGNLVGYSRVEEFELANNRSESIGKKQYWYMNFQNLSSNWFPVVTNHKNGLPMLTRIFDKQANLQQETYYYYQNLIGTLDCYYGLRIMQNFIGNIDPAESASGNGRSKYSYYAIPLISEWNMLSKKETKEYYDNNVVLSSEEYTYNEHGEVRTLSSKNSKNEVLQKRFYYSTDNIIGAEIDNALTEAHMTGVPVQTQTYNGSTLLSTQRTEFKKNHLSQINPWKIYSSKAGNTLEKMVTCDVYDAHGNLLQYTLENGTPVAYIWGYNNTLPIAKIENALYYDITTSLITDAQTKSVSGTEQQLRDSLTAIRNSVPDAMVTSYTYIPEIGVTSITDPKGDTEYYTYDEFGRLVFVKDKNFKILKKNEYHYISQN